MTKSPGQHHAGLLRDSWVILIFTIFAGCAHAQTTGAPPATTSVSPSGEQKSLTAGSSVDDVLDALDNRGDTLNDFTANVSLTDTDSAIGTETTLTGKIWMQRTDADDARLHVVFDSKKIDEKIKAEKSEYALDKGWLIDRKYADRIEVKRQVLKPGQKMNLLKLGEGPFPLPLGQDKADVHKMFEVKKFEPSNDDPAGTIHAQLIPKPGTQFEPKFNRIDFWVDPATRFPVKIETIDPNETTTRTTILSDIKINVGLTDKDFTLPEIDSKDWTLRNSPFED